MRPLSTIAAPGGGRIGYRIDGSAGGWIALLHGWCGAAALWDGVVPALAAQARVLAVSLPGFGGMAPPRPGAVTIRGMGMAVARLLDHLDIPAATLVGHSMGGPVAAETAIASPGRVGAILGIDTLSDPDYYGGLSDDEIHHRQAPFRLDYPGGMRSMVNAIVHPGTGDAVRASIADSMLAAAAPAFALEARHALLAWTVEQRWPQVACPAMLLNSPVLARLAAARPFPCLAAVPVETFESGHFPMLEATPLFGEALLSCWRRLHRP